MTEILNQLQPIFRDIMDDQGLIITRDSNGQSVAGWDSLAHINLVSTIESEFKIRFALGELQDLKNVGEMIDMMERKLANK